MFKTQIIGILGGDAEIRNLDSGQAAISFSVAHSEKWKDKQGNVQERTTWVKCTLWRKSDQVGVAKYLTKGAKVYAEGRATARAWNNAQGQPQASLELTVTELDPFCGGKQSNSTAAPAAQTAAPAQNTSAPIPNPAFTSIMDNDDLPF